MAGICLSDIRNQNNTIVGARILDKYYNGEYHFTQSLVVLEDLFCNTLLFDDDRVDVFVEPAELERGGLLEYLVSQYRTFIDTEEHVILCTRKNKVVTLSRSKRLRFEKFVPKYRLQTSNDKLIRPEGYRAYAKKYLMGGKIPDIWSELFAQLTEIEIAELLYEYTGSLIIPSQNDYIKWLITMQNIKDVDVRVDNRWYHGIINCLVYSSYYTEVTICEGIFTGNRVLARKCDIRIHNYANVSFDNVEIEYKRYDSMNFGVHETGWSAFYKGNFLASAHTKAECIKRARAEYNRSFKIQTNKKRGSTYE